MSIYEKYILPRVINLTCSLKPTMKQREKIVPAAAGRVLEIGIGSGLNLPFYDADKVQHVWGLDPSKEMWELAQKTLRKLDFDMEFLEAPAEAIPLDNDSVDTLMMTYTMCTIPDVLPALEEMRRVLKPGGRLLFCEHGIAPDESVRKWQNRLNPLWGKIGGGCNLNRPIPELIQRGGFKIQDLESMYIPGWRPASFNYWGSATQN